MRNWEFDYNNYNPSSLASCENIPSTRKSSCGIPDSAIWPLSSTITRSASMIVLQVSQRVLVVDTVDSRNTMCYDYDGSALATELLSKYFLDRLTENAVNCESLAPMATYSDGASRDEEASSKKSILRFRTAKSVSFLLALQKEHSQIALAKASNCRLPLEIIDPRLSTSKSNLPGSDSTKGLMRAFSSAFHSSTSVA